MNYFQCEHRSNDIETYMVNEGRNVVKKMEINAMNEVTMQCDSHDQDQSRSVADGL